MKEKSDVNLQEQVLEELDWEPSVNAAEIGVTVKDGIVTLSGYVKSYADKRAAEEAVQRVSGVKAVAEEIEVRLPGLSKRVDADIAKAAVDAIRWHVYLPEDKLKVKVEDGIVTLDGNVEWQFQKEKAVDAVRHLTGVRGVVNLIKVHPRITSGDIRSRIRKSMERTAMEDSESVTVSVYGSEVVLSGDVRTWKEREDAVRSAWSAPGVTKVVNNIKISPLTYV